MSCAFIPHPAAIAPPAAFALQQAAFALIAPLPTAFAACASDLRTGRIPNMLLLAGGTGALAFDLAVFGTPGMPRFLLGLLPPLLLLPAFLGRGVGAGDIKLLMVLGAFLGPRGSLMLLFLSLAFGGIFSLIILCRTHDPKSRLRLSVPVLAGLLLRLAGLFAGVLHG